MLVPTSNRVVQGAASLPHRRLVMSDLTAVLAGIRVRGYARLKPVDRRKVMKKQCGRKVSSLLVLLQQSVHCSPTGLRRAPASDTLTCCKKICFKVH